MFKSVDNQLDVQNFLDLAGLTYFWSKAKNYIDNKFTDTGWKANHQFLPFRWLRTNY